MELEPRDDFEQELRQALERRPAPPGLKRKVMERRSARQQRPSWFAVARAGLWMKVAASLLIAAMLGGGIEWRVSAVRQERRGEEARQQVLTALRITGHALSQVHNQLAAHDRGGELAK